MSLQHITIENFEHEVLESPVPVLVDFYASWCPPCQMLSPVLEKLAIQYQGKAKIVKVNTEEQPDLAAVFRIRSIPTLYFFAGGKAVDTAVGFVQPNLLQHKLNTLISKMNSTQNELRRAI